MCSSPLVLFFGHAVMYLCYVGHVHGHMFGDGECNMFGVRGTTIVYPSSKARTHDQIPLEQVVNC